MARFATGNEFSTNDQVTADKLNTAINSAKISGDSTDSTIAVADGVISVADSAINSAKLADGLTFSSTGAVVAEGTAPSIAFNDDNNSGTSPIISSDSTDGTLTIAAANTGADILMTAQDEVSVTTAGNARMVIGEDVSKDAAGSASAGMKVFNDIYATGDISADGDVAASLSSDERLKEDIKPIENATDKVNQLSGNTFKWKDCATYNGDDIGVIAQEVQKVIPSAVKERHDGYLKVDYSRIIPLLLESIKELSQKVETLEAKSHSHGQK